MQIYVLPKYVWCHLAYFLLALCNVATISAGGPHLLSTADYIAKGGRSM